MIPPLWRKLDLLHNMIPFSKGGFLALKFLLSFSEMFNKLFFFENWSFSAYWKVESKFLTYLQ